MNNALHGEFIVVVLNMLDNKANRILISPKEALAISKKDGSVRMKSRWVVV
jgi:hypothetical protein